MPLTDLQKKAAHASGWQAVRRALEMQGPDNPTMAEVEALALPAS